MPIQWLSRHTLCQGRYPVLLQLHDRGSVLVQTAPLANRLTIPGAVDYIFGDASVWFGECDIVSNGAGAITASSRETSSDSGWYAIDNCNIKAASGVSLTEEVYLGRPWRVLARVIYQNSVLSDIINPKGWTTMADGATPLYYEYNNSGAGSDTSDREYETSISAAVDKTTVLGETWGDWIDRSY